MKCDGLRIHGIDLSGQRNRSGDRLAGRLLCAGQQRAQTTAARETAPMTGSLLSTRSVVFVRKILIQSGQPLDSNIQGGWWTGSCWPERLRTRKSSALAVGKVVRRRRKSTCDSRCSPPRLLSHSTDEFYGNIARSKGNSCKQGDRVWLAVPRKGEISPRWDGPFVIKHRITEQIYRLDRRPKRDVIVHCDRLKQYDERAHRLTNEDTPTEPQIPTVPSVPTQDCPTHLQAPLVPPRPRPTSPPPPLPTPTEQTLPLTSPTIPPLPIPSLSSRPVHQRRRPARFRDYIIYALSFGRDGLKWRGSSVAEHDPQADGGTRLTRARQIEETTMTKKTGRSQKLYP
ncbi:hypothetical protein M514_11729 [Trichuris suis]|uniref:Uncharacterized protein n=1 Tax=Trichuris suis TaxID=68888 RepID=A0A085MW04_9BILA|nr:hypothetical protein M514_11729 [Trichuris suis]